MSSFKLVVSRNTVALTPARNPTCAGFRSVETLPSTNYRDRLEFAERVRSLRIDSSVFCDRSIDPRNTGSIYIYFETRLHCRFDRRSLDRLRCRQDCGWAFRTASKLLRHGRRHTGDRRHSCTLCGRAFLRAEHLRDHAARHKRAPATSPVTPAKTLPGIDT